MPRLLAGFQDLKAHKHTRRSARVLGGANGKNSQEVSLLGVVTASPSPLDAWATPGREGLGGCRRTWGRTKY